MAARGTWNLDCKFADARVGSCQFGACAWRERLADRATIVAVGTSLPELASSIAAARRGENDLAVGNVIGSNGFNTLVVVGIAAVIAPINATDPEVMSRDVPIMAALTLLLFFICLPFKKKSKGERTKTDKFGFGRIGGVLFLSLYVAYLVLLGIQSV